ncbi:MAG: hypothetical protein AAF149_14500 [Bacteroidota bacterium]
MSQRKKNIRLILVWLVLVLVTALVLLTRGDRNRINVARDLFAVEDVSKVDQVVITTPDQENDLRFLNGIWTLNNKYKADPQRVTVLFAILKQNKIRRKAASRKIASLDSAKQGGGISVKFLSTGRVVKGFDIIDLDGLTYFNDGGESYVVEIPGYRVDLGGIFKLDEGGWRNPLVFDLNWANLQEVNMIFPERPKDQFDVVYRRRYYTIKQLETADSTKLTDFLDNVSLLYVNDYLDKDELANYKIDIRSPKASIIVSDVGGNKHSLTIYNEQEGSNTVLGEIDSTDYALFDFNMIRKALRPKQYFSEQ